MFRLWMKLALVILLLGVGLMAKVERTNANDPYYWNWWRPYNHVETCNATSLSLNVGYSRNTPPAGATQTAYEYMNGVFQGSASIFVPAGHFGEVVSTSEVWSTPLAYPYTYQIVTVLFVSAGATSRSTITLTCYGPGQAVATATHVDLQ
jgi:hypothetical protein